MPTKPETKSIKAEIRALKSALNKKAKANLRECRILRKIIAKATKHLEKNVKYIGTFEQSTDRRIAILEGRLNS